ncbi:MAG: hypothetical protein AB1445_00190 [Bacillota bacterium]
MKLGLELLAAVELEFRPGDYVELELMLDGHAVPGSVGRDNYELHLLLAPGRRLGATGRLNVINFDWRPWGLNTGARPAWPVHFPKGRGGSLEVRLQSNVVAGETQARAQLVLRAVALCTNRAGATSRAAAEWPLSSATIRLRETAGALYIALPPLPAVPA